MNIFYFEDDPADIDHLQYYMKKIFTSNNFRYSRVADLNSEALVSFDPDIIFVDYYIDGKTAEELVKEIRSFEILRSVPIVITTGNKNINDIINCLKSGADDYISKSDLSTESLEKVVKNSIEKAKLQLELEQAKLLSMQQSKLASIGILAGGVAHEIANPLNILDGYLDILEFSLEEREMEDIDRILDKLKETSSRMAKIVHGMRSFYGDISRDKPQTVSVSEVISKTLEFSEQKIKSSRIVLTVECESQDLLIHVNGTQISQVILNLIFNAHDEIKGSKNPWIKIKAYRNGGYIEIDVIDSGKGINPDAIKNLFMPFYTTDVPG